MRGVAYREADAETGLLRRAKAIRRWSGSDASTRSGAHVETTVCARAPVPHATSNHATCGGMASHDKKSAATPRLQRPMYPS